MRWLRRRGEAAELQAVLQAQRRRDALDRDRAHAPLKRAPDAMLLDSTRLSLEAVVGIIVEAVQRAREAG